MAFPQLPSFMNNNNAHLQESNMGGSNQASGLDSITLGQLKAMVGSVPKPKQSWFDFKYDDEDTVISEIDEFYSYIEMPQVAENLNAWKGSYTSEWTKSSPAQRRAHVELLLESLEHRDAEIRFANARRLFYVLQGTFAETGSPEHQLHWIFENCKVVRAANGVSIIVGAMKIASSKHDLLCGLTDHEAAQLNLTPTQRADYQEEVLTEISVYLGMLYHLIEVFKSYDDFADELMSLDPPLPVYLFNVVSGLRDKSAKGYPIKKLLLVLWKTLLACCGGIVEYGRVKKLARELAGLPTVENGGKIKSSPLDMEAFRQETSVKYPTFTPGQQSLPTTEIQAPVGKAPAPLYTSKLAQAYSPIPIRHHYNHEDLEQNQMGMHSQQGGMGGPGGNMPFHSQNQGPGSAFRQNPQQQPATPAPSPPPPPPRPKKQQYQTDQTRPFLFPFSKSSTSRFGGKDAKLVPFAIDEADRLYNRHMYVSLSLAQMWRTREDCINSESGLEYGSGAGGSGKGGGVKEFESSTAKLGVGVVGRGGGGEGLDLETAETLPDVALLNLKIELANKAMEEAETTQEKRKAKQRKEDLMRLKRVEQIYSAVLPVLSGWVLVLLKLLLATVSASTNANTGMQPQSSTSSIFPPGVSSPVQDQPPPPLPTLDEIDVIRHREITSKAVSAILLLVLKWFKVSHAMKFHHLGQHLLDTNCLLLILKMFGLQEVSATVISKADSPDNNFFRYCLINFSQNPQPTRPEDHMPRPPRYTTTRTITLPNGEKHEEEIDQVTDYSWRNFFATINFAKIMQKLSKGRSHRIWMLVQYKSSAVLKRVLRVMHPMLQLHVLKLIKSQVPFCGRKWRQSNMKVITSIYLNCRPDLRDEWLTGTEVEDVSDAQAQEQALRHLVKFYNTKRYGAAAASQHGAIHRRSGSMSQHLEGLHPGPELSGLIRPAGTPNMTDSDVFPPLRSHAPDPSIFLPYTTEDIAFEEEYEEYLKDLGWSDEPSSGSSSAEAMFGGPAGAGGSGGTSAWSRLPTFGADIGDGISDSESIVSIGELGDEARLDPSREEAEDVIDENLNNWEHMSPKTMAALPKSPAGNRRSSSGNGLRPVIPFGLDDGSAVDLDDIEEPELGPMPREQTGPFGSGEGVDEVEYAYGV
ncbi:hypothetical protein BDN72DRAFT_812821 [Pluteus cervinus]|uniref:Uncharacterized protein n=1 Tax=Pluteus cervinus TaxID=181527 RepID=A0ACD3BA23_9AGAR|nr:hypothetical protein BDN72DRAFT_812821 [Pluteus cervinus]